MACRGPSSYPTSSTLFKLQCLHWALICSTNSTHLRGLFTHHEVVPCFSKICDWLPLNLSRDHYGLHQENNVRVIMELEVPKKHVLGLHYPLSWSNGLCNGRGKRRSLVAYVRGPCHRSAFFPLLFLLYFFLGGVAKIFIVIRKEGTKKGRRSNTKKNSQNRPFGHILEK